MPRLYHEIEVENPKTKVKSIKSVKKSVTPKNAPETKKRKRCPNGTKRDRVTGDCVPK